MPDPTEPLLGKIREFIEANGARFLVGIQQHDDALVIYFEANTIPFVKLTGAPFYQEAIGWGPRDARRPENLCRTHCWHADGD